MATVVRKLEPKELRSRMYRKLVAQLYPQCDLDARMVYIEWLLFQHPANANAELLPVYVCFEDGEPKGQLAVMPVRLRYRDGEISGGWVVDFAVVPEAQRRGFGTAAHAGAFADFEVLIPAGQTDKSLPFVLKNGFIDAGPLTRRKEVLRPLRWAVRRLVPWSGSVGEASSVSDPAIKAAVGDLFEVGRFEDLVPAAYYQTPGDAGEVIPERTAEYLRWRYFTHPFARYRIFGWRDARGEILYLVVRLVSVGRVEARLIDAFGVEPVEKSALTEAQCCLATHCRSLGADLFVAETSSGPVQEVGGRRWLSKSEAGMRIVYRFRDGLEPRFPATSRLRVFAGDSDIDLVGTWSPGC